MMPRLGERGIVKERTELTEDAGEARAPAGKPDADDEAVDLLASAGSAWADNCIVLGIEPWIFSSVSTRFQAGRGWDGQILAFAKPLTKELRSFLPDSALHMMVHVLETRSAMSRLSML